MTEQEDQQNIPIVLESAVRVLRSGGVIAYPTEAVFGLGCDPHNQTALQRIIDIKGRDAHKGFILIASDQSQLIEYLEPISVEQQIKLDEYWPGPVTFVIPARATIRNTLLAGYRDTLAVRVSSHPLVVSLCEMYGGAIVSTSANRSGEPALCAAQDVIQLLGTDLDLVIDAPAGTLDSPTKIFELASGKQLR
ncbi:MAG: L-threonylcarbamoyladenylate synthase [Granulosicoccus sp.]